MPAFGPSALPVLPWEGSGKARKSLPSKQRAPGWLGVGEAVVPCLPCWDQQPGVKEHLETGQNSPQTEKELTPRC